MSCEETNSPFPLVWTTTVCKQCIIFGFCFSKSWRFFLLRNCMSCQQMGKWHVHINIFMQTQSGWENTHTLYDRVNNHPKKVRLGLQRGANESNSKRSCDIDPSYLQALFSMQRIISVSPADTSLPWVYQRQAEGSWKAPHTPFKRSWTPLTPMSDRGEGEMRAEGAALSTW